MTLYLDTSSLVKLYVAEPGIPAFNVEDSKSLEKTLAALQG